MRIQEPRLLFTILILVVCLLPFKLWAASKSITMKGDVDGDGKVVINDVVTLIDTLLSDDVDAVEYQQFDVNGDGVVSIEDITELIDLLLSPIEVVYALTLNSDSIQFEKGDSLMLMASSDSEGFICDSVSWYSTNDSVAIATSIGSSAIIKAVNIGECDIVAEWMGANAVCHVKILPVELNSIKLEDDYFTMRVNENRKMKVTLTPNTYDIRDVVWSSSDSTVVMIREGVVTALSPGVCEIIVRANDLQATCTVAVLKTVAVNDVTFDMLPVNGGPYMMGSLLTQAGSYTNEKPQHLVTLSSFMIGQTEVTQELWHAVMNYTPGHFKGNPKHPVENVTWEDCQVFISKLNEMTGLNFHLPTEAQWEYAARGGERSCDFTFPGCNDINEVGWYYSNSAKLGEDNPDYGTHDVARLEPNELGIYDMCGNVREWCNDYYSPYTKNEQIDPTGPATGSLKVYRGGSWYDYSINCRITFRYPDYVTTKNDKTGLRLAL